MRTRFIAALAFVPALAVAQNAPAPAPAPSAPATTGINFSGVVFGNWQYHTEKGANPQNKFDLDRAYLTFKMPAGDKVSIRITADVSPQVSGTGYVIREKYAYLQYDFGKNKSGWAALARVGVLHTAAIEQEENFWPRWLGNVPVERAGYFASADVGVAGVLTLPHKQGEAYAVISNGVGYSKPESDRFKSYAARVLWTPLAESHKGIEKGLSIMSWVDVNSAAAVAVTGTQAVPVGNALSRNRAGVFVGLRDPNFTVGVDAATRSDDHENGVDTKGRLYSAYTVVRPWKLVNKASKVPVGFVARYDNSKTDKSARGNAQFVDVGALVDLNSRVSFAADYQEQLPKSGATGVATTKVYAVRFVANF